MWKFTDTSSREYALWMASVWKANAERNKQIETEKSNKTDQE